jgi:hypothetical protein
MENDKIEKHLERISNNLVFFFYVFVGTVLLSALAVIGIVASGGTI